MDIGWCASTTDEGRFRRVGFDYIETPLAPLGLTSAADVSAAARRLSSHPRPVFNYMLPQDLPLVGPTVNTERLTAYVRRAADLLHTLGSKILVFGSGWARTPPAGWAGTAAIAQIEAALQIAADAFRGSGARIAIEAQRPAECGALNRLADARELARRIGRPEVGVMVDTYHMAVVGDPIDDLGPFASELLHVQVADTDRTVPGEGRVDWPGLFRTLIDGGYDGRVSIEVMTTVSESQAARGLATLRQALRASKTEAARSARVELGEHHQ